MTTLTVRKGQNLSTLVKQYNATHKNKVSVAQVAKQNGVKDANKIQAGQKLRIGDGFETTRPKTAPKTTTPKTTPKTTTPKTTTTTTKETKTENNTVTKTPTQVEPAKQVREKGWFEWLVTYKPFGDNN